MSVKQTNKKWYKMTNLKETCTISSYYLPAIINGDYEGLLQTEDDLIDNWLNNFNYGMITINVIEGSEQEFCKCEITGLKGQTIDVEIWS